MLSIDLENKVVPPSERLDANPPTKERWQERWVYAGVIDATDQEIDVLRLEGGFAIRDLRTKPVADLLSEFLCGTAE